MPGYESPGTVAGISGPPVSLENVAEIENYLTSRVSSGEEITARVIRYNSRAVVVETEHSNSVSVGEALEGTTVTLGHRSMEVAGAVVLNVTEMAEKNLVEIGLPGIWQIEGFEDTTPPEELVEIVRSRRKPEVPLYSRFGQGIVERKIIPESYRSTVADLVDILQEFYDDLEPFENFLQEIDAEDRPAIEERMIQYAKGRFFPTLTDAMNRFESAAAAAEKEGIKEEFRRFTQKRLLPLMLCSPFLSRVIAKPIGVPGDFGILGRLLGDPFEGHSLFGRMLNAWAITANPSAAYRHRIDLLNRAINETVHHAGGEDREARILSMASGVAFEVQRFVKDPIPNRKVSFDLVDFSSETLTEAKRQFAECRKLSDPEGVGVNLRQGSVVDLVKSTKREVGRNEIEKYDLVYCAGLFDYLSQRLCSSVISYLYALTRKGGKVIVSNYTPQNALRYFMGIVLDWELIHRTPEEFQALMGQTTAREDFQIIEDDTRTELYAIARKI